MLIDTFANRLKQALELNNMKPIELSLKTNIDKSLISNYLSGNYKAKQDNLSKMAEVLNVSETWLMGYDVVMNNSNYMDKIERLYCKYKDKLTNEDKNNILNILYKYI